MKTCPLFAGIAESDYETLLSALSAKEDFFPKHDTVIQIGDPGKRAGLVLSGTLEVAFYDENASPVSVTRIESGNVFGAMMLCANVTDSSAVFGLFAPLAEHGAPESRRDPTCGKPARLLCEALPFAHPEDTHPGAKKIARQIKALLQHAAKTKERGSKTPALKDRTGLLPLCRPERTLERAVPDAGRGYYCHGRQGNCNLRSGLPRLRNVG